jgi:hypothetical protein
VVESKVGRAWLPRLGSPPSTHRRGERNTPRATAQTRTAPAIAIVSLEGRPCRLADLPKTVTLQFEADGHVASRVVFEQLDAEPIGCHRDERDRQQQRAEETVVPVALHSRHEGGGAGRHEFRHLGRAQAQQGVKSSVGRSR